MYPRSQTSEVSRTGFFGGEEGLGPSNNEAMCDIPCSRKIYREFYIADWPFFCGLREQIFAVRDD